VSVRNSERYPIKPARRHAVLEPHAPGAVIHHLGHLALAGPELLRDRADELLGDVHHEVLHRLEGLAVLDLRDDLGLA
jgi:hypothetical protein